jgi:hypothetical protein
MYKMNVYAEPYAASGNIGDGGLRKLLGAPQLDVLETLLREAVQNCCDASEPGTGPRILIRLRTLNELQLSILKDNIFNELPSASSSRTQLESFLNSPHPQVFEICDFNTQGLSGPTRADQIPIGTTSTNFINFMRNFGSNNHKTGRGGTYGFGKASLYMASECQTILVDTCTTHKGNNVRRLMGCHLGLQHMEENTSGNAKQFTGRHWWGAKTDTDFVDPLEGVEAENLSIALGFPSRLESQNGTSIMILAPCLENNTKITAGVIQEILLWYFWPRLTEDADKSKKISFQLEIEGKEIKIPRPEDFPPLDLFSLALKKLKSDETNRLSVYSKKPFQLLGKLSTIKSLKAERISLVPHKHSMIPMISSHIAVMRPVELVVRYYEGAALPDESVEWAGIFIADESMNEAFSLSEPPAHDDWQPKNIADPKIRSFVNVAIKHIKQVASSFASPSIQLTKNGNNDSSFASASSVIGDILSTSDGSGAGRNKTEYSNSVQTRKNVITKPVFLSLETLRGKRVALFETTVKLKPDSKNISIIATPLLAIDGSATLEKHPFAEHPKTFSISSIEESSLSTLGNQLFIGNKSGKYLIKVLIPDECVSTLNLQLLDTPDE